MYYLTTGKNGEQLAARWLKEHGYKIIELNWRNGRYEIDIIAQKENVLHCIEVKTRRSTAFGFPEQGVTENKLKNMMEAAAQTSGAEQIQIDIIAILAKSKYVELLLIENAGSGYHLQYYKETAVATLRLSSGNTEKKSKRMIE